MPHKEKSKPKSKEARLQEVHEEAIHAFSKVWDNQQDVRQQCYDDRRFGTIAGAQWEDKFGEQFENRVKLEGNKLQLSCLRIYNEYRNNRITVNFEPADGSTNPELSEFYDDVYRSDARRSNAKEAGDNAFDEGVMGGFGGWRLSTEYEDEFDDDKEEQRIVIEPIFDADRSLFFSLDGKLQSKKDSTRAWLLSTQLREDFIEEYDEDPVSWPIEFDEDDFDWTDTENDLVYKAEYYQVEKGTDTEFTYKTLLDEEVIVTQREIDADEESLDDDEVGIIEELKATGAKLINERKYKFKAIHKYIMSGGGILSDEGIIAGKMIPLVPYYGKRWYINSIERCMGHIRLPKDMQRLDNMQISALAELSGYSGKEKPVFTPGQIKGNESYWEDDNVEDYAYLLVNPSLDKDGNEVPLTDIAYTKSPQIPPVTAALMQITGQNIKELTGNQEAGEKIASNISRDTIELVQERLDMQTFIYMDNFAKSKQLEGEIWMSMASEIYHEKGRVLKGVNSQNKTRAVTLKTSFKDPNSNKIITQNDFSRGDMDVVVEVGPASATRRQSTVRTLGSILQITRNEETADVLTSMIMMNMEGEGLSDVKEFFRFKLVRQGIVTATDEDKEQLAEEAKAQQDPTPSDKLITAEAERAAALTGKAVADTEQSQAKTQNLQADTAETLSGIERDDQTQLIDTVEKLNQ